MALKLLQKRLLGFYLLIDLVFLIDVFLEIFCIVALLAFVVRYLFSQRKTMYQINYLTTCFDIRYNSTKNS